MTNHRVNKNYVRTSLGASRLGLVVLVVDMDELDGPPYLSRSDSIDILRMDCVKVLCIDKNDENARWSVSLTWMNLKSIDFQPCAFS